MHCVSTKRLSANIACQSMLKEIESSHVILFEEEKEGTNTVANNNPKEASVISEKRKNSP